MDIGELAEGNDIVLRDVIGHGLEQLLDISRLSRLDLGDDCQCYLVRHKQRPSLQ